MSARIRDGGALRNREPRIGLWICLIVAAFLLVAGGAFFACHVYSSWRADEAVEQAKATLEKGDVPGAMVALRTALRHRPDHVEAHRMLASLLETSRSSEALVHRRRVMDLQPQFVEPKLSFARSALLFDRPREAALVLDGIKGSRRNHSAFMEVRAEFFSPLRAPIWLLRSIVSCWNGSLRIGICARGSPRSNCKAVPNKSATLRARRWKRLRPMKNSRRSLFAP